LEFYFFKNSSIINITKNKVIKKDQKAILDFGLSYFNNIVLFVIETLVDLHCKKNKKIKNSPHFFVIFGKKSKAFIRFLKIIF
jgi:hypothetical protein